LRTSRTEARASGLQGGSACQVKSDAPSSTRSATHVPILLLGLVAVAECRPINVTRLVQRNSKSSRHRVDAAVCHGLSSSHDVRGVRFAGSNANRLATSIQWIVSAEPKLFSIQALSVASFLSFTRPMSSGHPSHLVLQVFIACRPFIFIKKAATVFPCRGLFIAFGDRSEFQLADRLQGYRYAPHHKSPCSQRQRRALRHGRYTTERFTLNTSLATLVPLNSERMSRPARNAHACFWRVRAIKACRHAAPPERRMGVAPSERCICPRRPIRPLSHQIFASTFSAASFAVFPKRVGINGNVGDATVG